MKKLTLLLLIAISCGFYTGIRAQVNVTSVSEKNDADNFYKMMKEAFPLSFNDPASPRFVFFNKNKNFVFGVGGFVQVQGIYDFNGVPNDNYFTTNAIALKGEQSGGRYGIRAIPPILQISRGHGCRQIGHLHGNGIRGEPEYPNSKTSFYQV